MRFIRLFLAVLVAAGGTWLFADSAGKRTTYDELGNKISQTDALGRITKWEYDNLGRMTKRTLPLGAPSHRATSLIGGAKLS